MGSTRGAFVAVLTGMGLGLYYRAVFAASARAACQAAQVRPWLVRPPVSPQGCGRRLNACLPHSIANMSGNISTHDAALASYPLKGCRVVPVPRKARVAWKGRLPRRMLTAVAGPPLTPCVYSIGVFQLSASETPSHDDEVREAL